MFSLIYLLTDNTPPPLLPYRIVSWTDQKRSRNRHAIMWLIDRSRSRLSRWRTLTAMAERHIDTVPLSIMHCGWEGNRRSAVALHRILNARAKGHIDVAGYLLFLQCPTLSAAGRAPSFSVRSECRTFPPGHISLGRSPLPRIFSLPD